MNFRDAGQWQSRERPERWGSAEHVCMLMRRFQKGGVEVDEGEARQDGAERTRGGLAFDEGRGSPSTAVTSRHHKPCRGLTALHQPVTGQSTVITNPSLCDVLSAP